MAHSICVGLILEAAEKLAAEGIDAELIDLRTLRPLDTETVLASVRKTNRIVTVEQGWPICSIGSEIASVVALEAFDWLDAPPTKVTGKDVPMPYAANLEKLALPHVEGRRRGGQGGLLQMNIPLSPQFVMGGLDPPIHRARVCGRSRRLLARRRAPDGWPAQGRP